MRLNDRATKSAWASALRCKDPVVGVTPSFPASAAKDKTMALAPIIRLFSNC